jgi:hypothetical protein
MSTSYFLLVLIRTQFKQIIFRQKVKDCLIRRDVLFLFSKMAESVQLDSDIEQNKRFTRGSEDARIDGKEHIKHKNHHRMY